MFREVLVISVIFISGCATKRTDVSQEEWKVREFQGVSKEQVISAAREVLRLADPSDIKFENIPDGFNATRTSTGYYVVQSNIDVYSFNFIAQEKNGVTRSRLDIEETEVKSNLLTLGLPHGVKGKPERPYIYELFYARVGYLLGLNTHWHNCVDTVSRIAARNAEENNVRKLGMASLCGAFADDNTPDAASKKVDLFGE